MPDLIVSNEGEKFLLRRSTNPGISDFDPLSLRLYGNDYVPNRDVVLGNLVEMFFPGYAPAVMANALWTRPVTIDGKAVAWWKTTPTAFEATSGIATAYGYYITSPAESPEILVLVQRFDTPQLILPGTPALVQPQLIYHSEYEPPV